MKQKSQLETLRDLYFVQEKSKQSITDYWKNEFINNPYFENVFITVDLILSTGRVLRLAVDRFSVSKGTETIGYLPFLVNEPEISSSYTFLSGDGSQRSISIEIDGRIIKPMSALQSGSFLAGIGEISLQKADGIYNNRLVLMKGEMTGGISFGTDTERVSVTLSDPILSKDFKIPKSNHYILKGDDFPDLPEDQMGEKFPLIIGRYEGGVPCIRITANRYGPQFLVGYGWQIQVTGVVLDGRDIPSDDIERGWEIKTATTPSGIPYTYIDFVYPNSMTTPEWTQPNIDNAEVYEFQWVDNAHVYAIVGERSVFAVSDNETMMEQIKFFITNYSGFGIDGFDIPSYNRAIIKDPGLKIQTLINGSTSIDSTTVLEYIQSTISDSFPMVSLIYTGIGIGVIYTDRRNTTVYQSFIKGQKGIIDRASQFAETSTEEVFNSFVLKYAYDTANDVYTKMITADYTNNKLCEISAARLGHREYGLLESVTIFDDRTAIYIVNWLAAHISLPRYIVQYTVAPDLFLYLSVGDNIKITDEEMGLEGITSTITEIIYNKKEMIITVDMWIIQDKLEKLSVIT